MYTYTYVYAWTYVCLYNALREGKKFHFVIAASLLYLTYKHYVIIPSLSIQLYPQAKSEVYEVTRLRLQS